METLEEEGEEALDLDALDANGGEPDALESEPLDEDRLETDLDEGEDRGEGQGEDEGGEREAEAAA